MLGVPLLLLLVAEGLLRWAGFGYPTGFFLPRQLEGRAVLIDNQEFGKRFFPPGLVRYPRPFTMPEPKPAEALRIFVLGESAALGDPEPKFGLPRMLERLLRERFPERRIDVINVAMVAINSHVVRKIAQECAQRQGDLWVIYMGNNEMIGPYGSISVFGSQAPPLPLIRASVALKTTRLGQVLDAAIQSLRRANQPPLEWGGMTMMAEQKIRRDDPRTARVYRHFQSNLADILQAGRRAGVPMVLCTVATNLKDCAPFASLHRGDLAASALIEWEAAYQQGIALESQGKAEEASLQYQRAATIDPDFADLRFRQARCALILRRGGEARQHFRAARDQDALQFRADSRLNDLIRESAQPAVSGVRLLDAEELFASQSADGVAGEHYFHEHVHLNPAGNYLLARAVAEQVAAALSLGAAPSGGKAAPKSDRVNAPAADDTSRPAAAPAWLAEADCLRALGFTEWNRFDILKLVIERLEQPPFTGQIDHAPQLSALGQQLERSRLASKPSQVKRSAQQVAEIVAQRPDDADLRWILAQLLDLADDPTSAETHWRAAIRLLPQASLPYYNLARLLDIEARPAEAEPLYRQCLTINPDYYEARFALGALLTRLGRFAEALPHLHRAVRQKPRAIEARLALGVTLSQLKKSAQAQREFREVLRLDPENAEARKHLQTEGGGN